MVDKKQQEIPKSRITDKERKILESLFKEDYFLLIALRKFLWQAELTEQEDVMIRNSFNGNSESVNAVRRYLASRIEQEENSPINILQDVWTQTANEIREAESSEGYIQIKIASLTNRYLEQQLKMLEGEKVTENFIIFRELEEQIDNEFTADKEKREVEYINFMARHKIISHIEQKLGQIYMLVMQNVKTPEEMLKDLGINSSK